jgi:hypothetical protein
MFNAIATFMASRQATMRAKPNLERKARREKNFLVLPPPMHSKCKPSFLRELQMQAVKSREKTPRTADLSSTVCGNAKKDLPG